MMAKATAPAAGAELKLMFIADQDQASKVGEDAKWETKLASGILTYNGAKGDQSYTLAMGPEATLYTSRGDKSGRGAEYSALELFDGKLLTMCDRTGNCDEITITADGTLDIVPLVDAAGTRQPDRLPDCSPSPMVSAMASHSCPTRAPLVPRRLTSEGPLYRRHARQLP